MKHKPTVLYRHTMANRRPAPASPCIRNCCLDDQHICLGCGRSLPEILEWNNAGSFRRQAIIVSAKKRAAFRNSQPVNQRLSKQKS